MHVSSAEAAVEFPTEDFCSLLHTARVGVIGIVVLQTTPNGQQRRSTKASLSTQTNLPVVVAAVAADALQRTSPASQAVSFAAQSGRLADCGSPSRTSVFDSSLQIRSDPACPVEVHRFESLLSNLS